MIELLCRRLSNEKKEFVPFEIRLKVSNINDVYVLVAAFKKMQETVLLSEWVEEFVKGMRIDAC